MPPIDQPLPSFDDMVAANQQAPGASDEQLPSFDEMAAAGQEPPLPSFDEMVAAGQKPPGPEVSTGGAFASGAVRGVGPAAGAVTGGLAGAELGSTLGPVGAVVGGLGGALVGGYLGGQAQEKVTKATGLNEGEGILSDKYAQAAEEQHPYASMAGGLSPLLAAFTTGGPEVTIAARVLSGGIFGATELGSEAVQGHVDPTKVALAAGAGALLPQTRPWVGRASQAVAGRVTGRPNTPQDPGAPAARAESEAANDVTSTAIGATNDNVAETHTPDYQPAPDIQGATIDVVRSDTRYPKGPDTRAAEGVPGAQSTVVDTSGNTPADISAALSTEQPETSTPYRRQQQQPPPGPERRAPAGPAFRAPQTNEPLTPAEEQAPTAQPGVPPARQGIPTLNVDPHIQAILDHPNVKAGVAGPVDRTKHVPAIAGSSADMNDPTTFIDRSVPEIAVLPSGKQFRTAPPLQLHEHVERFVQAALEKGGMKSDVANRVAHYDFAEPAEDAYYKANNIDPAEAEQFWQGRAAKLVASSKDRPIPENVYDKGDLAADNNETAQSPRPTPEEQAQAGKILGMPEKELGAQEATAAEPSTAVTKTASEGAKPELSTAVKLAAQRLREHGEEERAAKLEANPDEGAAYKINKMYVANAPENRPKATSGVMVRSAKDAERKNGALAAVKAAVDEHPPGEDEDDQAFLDRMKAIAAKATDKFNGKNPTDRAEGYAPREKPPEWKIVRGAQRIAAMPNPTDETIASLRAEELNWRGGGTEKAGAAELAALVRNKKPTTEEVAPANTEAISRPTYPDVPQDTTALAEDRQALHDYLNGLSDDDYSKLVEIYRDPSNPEAQSLQRVVETSSDPHKLQVQMEATLEPTEKGPGNFDLVDARDEGVPVAKMERIVNAKPLGESQGAASEGVSRKDLIAEYNRKLAAGQLPGGNKLSTEARLAAAEQTLKNPENLERPQKRSVTETPAPTPPEVQEPIQPMFRGQMPKNLGAVTQAIVDKFGDQAQKVAPYLFGGKFDPASPDALPEVKSIPAEISDWFHRFTGRGQNTDMKLRAATAKYVAYGLTKDEETQIRRAIENRSLANLPDKLKQAYVDNIRPLQLEQSDLMETIRDEFPQSELEAPYPGYKKDFVPRMNIAEDMEEKQPDVTYFKRNLSTFRGAAQPRDFFTLRDGAGRNLVMTMGDEGQLTILRNGAPQSIKNVPIGFNGKPGDTIDLTVKGKPSTFTVDHSTLDELKQNVKGVDYVDNPFFTFANSVRQLSSMRDTLRVLRTLQDPDGIVMGRSTTSAEKAKQLGYKQTQLKEMDRFNGHQRYYDPQIANIFDDFVKPGFGTVEDLQGIRNVVHHLSNTLYFFNPPIHALNEANLWAIARGFDWLKPTEYYHLATEGLESMKSVYTQDGFNRDMRQVGGNPMLASVLLRGGVMRQIGEKLGLEMARDPSMWDGVTRLTGVHIPDVAAAMMKISNSGMWYANDVFLQSLVRRNMRVYNETLEQAVHRAHEHISDYFENQGTVGSPILGQRWGRLAQQFLMDPSTSWFGRYHLGLFRSFGNMMHNFVAPETPQRRADAIGQLLMLGALTWGLGPLLDKGAQALTGNEHAKVNPRGLSTIAKAVQGTIENPGDYTKFGQQVWTPSIPVKGVMEAASNKDLFTGHDIVPAGTPPARAGVKVADAALRAAIPPYDTASRFAGRPGAGPLDVAKGFAEGMVGISEPSKAGVKWQRAQDQGRHTRQVERQSTKKPGGLLETGFNKL